nr:PREDICTED: uncharacterized protein LOC107399183 [Tribolium castaneum]|eukprot:XP_015840425.1 PREDICTED: uncharacterized protein LOC107399183 [Tribolium castaneum]
MPDKKGEESTVQGVGSPVPVEAEVRKPEWASLDGQPATTPTLLVGDQAGMSNNTTGTSVSSDTGLDRVRDKNALGLNTETKTNLEIEREKVIEEIVIFDEEKTDLDELPMQKVLLQRERSFSMTDVAFLKNIEEDGPAPKESDLIIWVDKDDLQMEKGLPKMARQRFPELGELQQEWSSIEEIKIDANKEIVRKKRNTEAIIISQTGKDYVEILKNVKHVVGNKIKENEIRGVRKTQNGHLLLTLEKDSKKMEEVKALLQRNMEGANITIRKASSNLVTLHIHNMDATTTKEEVEQAVKNAVGHDCELKIGNLGPMYGENQAVTLLIEKENATKLIKEGKIIIGLAQYSIKEGTVITRCKRCLEYGHENKDCRNPDRHKLCLNCGKEGHIAKQCEQQELYCLICDEKGHRAGTIKCINFKQELRKARKKAFQKY